VKFGDPRLPKRFWDKVEIDSETGCWNWTAGKLRGYGAFKLEGKQRAAHRVSYEALVGAIDSETLDHVCCDGKNKRCVHPLHLEPVTRRENFRRGSSTRGERKIRCRNNHPATPENTYIWHNKKSGLDVKMCRECIRQSARRAYYKQKAMT